MPHTIHGPCNSATPLAVLKRLQTVCLGHYSGGVTSTVFSQLILYYHYRHRHLLFLLLLPLLLVLLLIVLLEIWFRHRGSRQGVRGRRAIRTRTRPTYNLVQGEKRIIGLYSFLLLLSQTFALYGAFILERSSQTEVRMLDIVARIPRRRNLES